MTELINEWRERAAAAEKEISDAKASNGRKVVCVPMYEQAAITLLACARELEQRLDSEPNT
jgi:hypothetical protein